MKWIQHLPTSWQLETRSGLKVWLVRGLKNWEVYIGDYPDVKLFDPNLPLQAAQRCAVTCTIGYLHKLIRKLQ